MAPMAPVPNESAGFVAGYDEQGRYVVGYDDKGGPQYADDRGSQTQQKGQPVAVADTDGAAITALVFGILWVGGLGALIAVILGRASASQARRHGNKPASLAMTAEVLGWIGLAGALIALIVIVVVLTHTGQSACDPSNPNWPNC